MWRRISIYDRRFKIRIEIDCQDNAPSAFSSPVYLISMTLAISGAIANRVISQCGSYCDEAPHEGSSIAVSKVPSSPFKQIQKFLPSN